MGLLVDLCLGSTTRSTSDLRVADHVDGNGEAVKGGIILVEDVTAAGAKKGGRYHAETVFGVQVEGGVCEVGGY